MTINGGAAVALLAFVGHVVTTGHAQGLVARFAWLLTLFVLGVLGGAVAFGVRYLTQWFYRRRHQRAGHTCNLLSVLFTIGCYFVFAIAALQLYSIFR